MSLWIQKFLSSVKGSQAEVFCFDPKSGREIDPKLIELQCVQILSPDDPESYLAAIEKIHAKASAISRYKHSQGCIGSINELWMSGHIGSGRWGPTIIVVDEFVEQVELEKDDDDLTKERKVAMRKLLQKSLRRYATVGMHTILLSQSARATDRALLGAAATDSVSCVFYGRQDRAMAQSLGLPILSLDKEIQSSKGVFVYRGVGLEGVKFYAK